MNASSIFTSDFSIFTRIVTLAGLVGLGAAIFGGICQLTGVVTVQDLRKMFRKSQ